MQFIESKEGKFQVTDEARALLSTTWADIALSVVTVVGSYRIGKSSLLNWLTGLKDVFPTSDEVHAKTRGLWMAKELHNENILYLDSEGLSNIEIVDRKYDLSIFALCIALSSKLIVNTGHVLKSDELRELQDVGKISAMLNKCGGINNHPPELLWIFRNSTLKLTHAETKEPMSATEYLETSLTKIDSVVSQDLFQMFPKRHAITLPKPSSNDQDIINQHFDKFTPKFKNAFDLIRQEVFNTEQKMCGNGTKLTGHLFLAMADSLCKVLSSDDVDMNVVMQSLSTAATVRCSATVGNEFKQYIQNHCDKRKSFYQQTVYLPRNLVLNLHDKLLEIPSLEFIAHLLDVNAHTIIEQEKSHCAKFFQQLALENVDEILNSVLTFYGAEHSDIIKAVKEKTQHMNAEKWSLLQSEIESKQQQLESALKTIQTYESDIGLLKDDQQEKEALLDKLKTELSKFITERHKAEDEIALLKIELNSTNENLEQYTMVIKELKLKCETRNEDKAEALEKQTQLLQNIEDLKQCLKAKASEIETKKQFIDDLQERFTTTVKEHNKKMELMHFDIVNERTRNTREEDRCTKRLKVYQDASAQHVVETNELMCLRQQKVLDAAKIAELQSQINSNRRLDAFTNLMRRL